MKLTTILLPLALFAGILLVGLILPSNAEAKSAADDTKADADAASKDASGNGDAEATPAS